VPVLVKVVSRDKDSKESIILHPRENIEHCYKTFDLQNKLVVVCVHDKNKREMDETTDTWCRQAYSDLRLKMWLHVETKIQNIKENVVMK